MMSVARRACALVLALAGVHIRGVRAESPMQPADLEGRQGGLVGLELQGLSRAHTAATQYATTAPACDEAHSVAADGTAEAYADLSPTLRDAFTLDGRKDMWILPDCVAVLEELRDLECVPSDWPEWLWCKWTKAYGQPSPHLMPVRPFEYSTAWEGVV